MGLISRLFKREKDKEVKAEVKKIVNETMDEFITRCFNDNRETDAMKLSAVYSAISCISNTMSKIPFSIINRYTKEEIKNEPLYNVLNLMPNERMNASVMHKMLWTWVLSEGEAYCIPTRRFRSNEVLSIIPVSPDRVSKSLKDGNLIYDVTVNSETKRFRPDEIIHLKAMTINGIDGVSPLSYARQTIQTGLNQEAFTEDFYKNYGRPLDYLQTDTDLSSRSETFQIPQSDGTTQTVEKSMKDILRESWQKAHSGENRFSIAILDNGLKYGTVPQISPEDMQFVESKTANVADIARFFDMASCAFKLGIGKQTYSTNEQGQICYITETIVPKLRQWETELTLKLLTEEQRSKGWVVKGNINAELRGDTAARANWYDKMRSMGVYNINEIRAFEDMPSIGEKGETRLIGANSIPLERLLAGDTAASATPNDLEGTQTAAKENQDE